MALRRGLRQLNRRFRVVAPVAATLARLQGDEGQRRARLIAVDRKLRG